MRQKQENTAPVTYDFNAKLGIVPATIIDIKPYKHDKPGVDNVLVYDFTVEDTHKYTLDGGILVSNSKRLGSMETTALAGHG